MKKTLTTIILTLIMITVFSACGESEQPEASLDPANFNTESYTSIEGYLLNSERLEGNIVTVSGLLDQNCSALIEPFTLDKSLNLDISDSDLDTIHPYAKVDVTGRSCIGTDGLPYLDVISYTAYETLDTPYWTGTTLITSDNALRLASDQDPSEYFEFDAMITASNGIYYQLIGLDFPMVLYDELGILYNDSSEYYGKVYHILANQVGFVDDIYTFTIVDSFER